MSVYQISAVVVMNAPEGEDTPVLSTQRIIVADSVDAAGDAFSYDEYPSSTEYKNGYRIMEDTIIIHEISHEDASLIIENARGVSKILPNKPKLTLVSQ